MAESMQGRAGGADKESKAAHAARAADPSGEVDAAACSAATASRKRSEVALSWARPASWAAALVRAAQWPGVWNAGGPVEVERQAWEQKATRAQEGQGAEAAICFWG